jgi:hypothetical protein
MEANVTFDKFPSRFSLPFFCFLSSSPLKLLALRQTQVTFLAVVTMSQSHFNT